ncbi:MAG: HEAT repeat domain-containing protein [Cyanobacteria bacterium P01_C01_bin.120]
MSAESEQRSQRFEQLSAFPQPQFEQLLSALNVPAGIISGPSAPQGTRVGDLLNWAEGGTGCGLEELEAAYDQVKNANLIDFAPYLQSILEDEDYREWHEVYTPTTVEGRTPLSQPKFSRLLKLQVETVTQQKEEPKPKAEQKDEQKPEAEREDEQNQESAREKVAQWDALAGLRKYAAEHMLLIGKPGSGKSTSLERLLWEEAQNALQDSEAKIPVLIKLRRCTSTIEHLIQDFLSRHQLPLAIAEIEHLLQQGKLLLLLDGLNELPEIFVTAARNFRDRYHKTTPMIVSTRDLAVGGTLGIDKALKMLPLTEAQMQEFVRGYLGEAGDRLFQQLRGDRLRKFAETPLLLWMLCRVFAQNGQVPDNLGLAFREFTQLYDAKIQEDAPTESREQWPKLLRHLAFALMHGEELVDFRLSMPREDATDLLTACFQQEDRANARDCAERWLQDLLDYHLLQPVRQANFAEHIEFRHQLIQEYYAAEALQRRLPDLLKDENTFKRDYLNLLKWTEPIALMLALVNEEEQALRVVRLAINVDVVLASRLTSEIGSRFQERAFDWIVSLEYSAKIRIYLLMWTLEVSDNKCAYSALSTLACKLFKDSVSRNSRFSVEALLFSVQFSGRSSSEIELILEASCDQSADVRERAIYGLIELIDRHQKKITEREIDGCIDRLLEAIENEDLQIQRKILRSLNVFRTDTLSEFIEKIEARNFCLFCLKALEKSDKVSLVKKLVSGSNNIFDQVSEETWLLGLKVFASSSSGFPLEKYFNLFNFSFDDVLSGFDRIFEIVLVVESFKCLKKLKIRSATKMIMVVCEALNKKTPDEYWLEFRRIIDDTFSPVHKKIEEILENEEESHGLPELSKVLEDYLVDFFLDSLNSLHSEVRGEATKGLGLILHDSVISNIKDAFYDSDDFVCVMAVQTLSKIGSELAIQELTKALNHENPYIRRYAAYELGEKDSSDLTIKLLKALEPYYSMGNFVSVSIPDLDPDFSDLTIERIVPSILRACKHGDPTIRQLALRTLEGLGGEGPIIELIKAMEHPSYQICQLAEYILSLVGGDIFPALHQALNHHFPDVRSHAAKLIAAKFSNQAVPELLDLLHDVDAKVRSSVVKALGEIKDSTTVSELLYMLGDYDFEVCRCAIEALGKIGNERAIPGLLSILEERDYDTVDDLIYALERIGDERAIPALLNLLEEDIDPDTCRSIARAIGEIANPSLLIDIRDSFLEGDNTVQFGMRGELEILWSITEHQEECKFYNYEIWQEAI